MPNLSNPLLFGALTLAVFVLVIGRYFLIAGLFHAWFYTYKKNAWPRRQLGKKVTSKQQYYKEIRWSSLTALIFAVAGGATAWLWQQGYTRLYANIHDFSLWWLPASLALSMLIHETYYYWLHRWMHRPGVFKLLHQVHHDSSSTSVWTSFSFHPLEGLLQAIILPLTILVLPLHFYVLLTQLTIMTLSSVINHLEIETYPANFHRHFIGKWLIGATHHSLHHKQFKYNFGLYFTFWDKWKKTESPRFPSLFEEKTS